MTKKRKAKKIPRARSRLAWGIVMRGGRIDEIGFIRKHLYPITEQGEHLIRVLVSAAPVKKARKRA